MNDLFDILNVLQDSNCKKVLSTIIDVKGSSYRKEGAMMLHMEDGTQVGLLSGGCLEGDLALIADEVIQEKHSRTIVYNMTSEDDLIFGLGSGCNGKISVLMEPVNDVLEKHFIHMYEYLKQGIPVLHLKKLSESGDVLGYVFITQNQQLFGEWSEGNPLQFIKLFAKQEKDGIFLGDSSERYFLQFFRPKPRIILFGATPDVRPLVSFAARTGFHTIVTDWRPAFCNKDLFLDANEIILDSPSSFLSQFSFSDNDSVVIMTHHFQKDQEILNTLLQKRLHYLGILGPRKRTLRLLEGKEIPDRLHSPVGLPIGGEGPEEIAISILAEIIKTIRKSDSYDCWNIPSSRSKQKNGLP